MKVYALMLLLFLVGKDTSAQCRYEIDRIDKFTNQHENLTEELVVARKVKRKNALPLRKILVQLKNFNNYTTFVLKFPLTAVMSPTFADTDEESHLLLLLEDNSKLKLPLAKLMGNQAEGVELRYATDFLLREKDIQRLKKYKITDIRVGMKVNSFDISLEKSAAKILRDYFGCMH